MNPEPGVGRLIIACDVLDACKDEAAVSTPTPAPGTVVEVIPALTLIEVIELTGPWSTINGETLVVCVEMVADAWKLRMLLVPCLIPEENERIEELVLTLILA